MEIAVKKEKKEADKTEDKPFWITLLHTPLLHLSKKIFDDSEENLREYYNAVYKVLPYPPNTKDVKDSFIERT